MMYKINRQSILLIAITSLLFLFFVNTVCAQEQKKSTTFSVKKTTIITKKKLLEIEKYINYFDKHNKLLGTVSISENNKEIYTKELGKTYNPQGNIKYQIGSITKMFTAVILAQLEEQNKIDFAEPLSNYFPNIPNAEKITILSMLNHTSGLSDFINKTGKRYGWLKKPQTEKDIIREIQKTGIEFAVGDSTSYSNSAYYLLAKIAEQKYKKKYSTIIDEQITNPLGLHYTYASQNSRNQMPPKSYKKRKKGWKEIKEFYFPNIAGVGDIISTPQELNTFINALYAHKLVNQVTLDKMQPKNNNWFGLGIMKIPFYDVIVIGHSGKTKGTSSITSYHPNDKLAISYSINGEGYPNNDFAIGLLSIIYNKDFKYPLFE